MQPPEMQMSPSQPAVELANGGSTKGKLKFWKRNPLKREASASVRKSQDRAPTVTVADTTVPSMPPLTPRETACPVLKIVKI